MSLENYFAVRDIVGVSDGQYRGIRKILIIGRKKECHYLKWSKFILPEPISNFHEYLQLIRV